MKATLIQKTVCHVQVIAGYNYIEINTGAKGSQRPSDVILVEEEKIDEFLDKIVLIKNHINKKPKK